MNNPFELSDDNKRYQTYNYYLKHRFGCKVYRIALDAGAGCPNRDGERGTGGCIFCSAAATARGKFCGMSEEALRAQFERGREKIAKKCADGPYIAYFQAGTNTYGDTEAFRRIFESALSFDNVCGITVATRADCIDDEKADMLEEISKKTYLTVELGLQTAHNETADFCNRRHSFEEFLTAHSKLVERGINVGVHIINGLPHESAEMMIDTARALAKLKLHCIKIHLLYIQRGTEIARMYERGEFEMISREEYIRTVCSQLEVLPKEVIIARLTGDGERSKLIAPEWSLKKLCIMNEIDKEMQRRGTWQGKLYNV
jgi:hypothetical protein